MMLLDFLKQQRSALKNGAYTSNLQPVNSDLRPFREKRDHVLFFSLPMRADCDRAGDIDGLAQEALRTLSENNLYIIYNIYKIAGGPAGRKPGGGGLYIYIYIYDVHCICTCIYWYIWLLYVGILALYFRYLCFQ